MFDDSHATTWRGDIMIFRLKGIEIYNFRGISSLILDPENDGFADMNIFVGPNGMGKSTIHAAISRLIPVFHGRTERLFLGSDFCFKDMENAPDIQLIYYLEINLDVTKSQEKNLLEKIESLEPKNMKSSGLIGMSDDIVRLKIEVKGRKIQEGGNRSFLNEQIAGEVDVSCTDYDKKNDKSYVIKLLKESNFIPEQRLRAFPSPGNRIAPVLYNTKPGDSTSIVAGHAATSEKDEMGHFDGLRARLVQILKHSDLGEKVKQRHPKLLENILQKVTYLEGKEKFKNITLGFNDILILERINGTFQSWDSLSGGERSMFDLAMIAEFKNPEVGIFLLCEEPENCVHTGLLLKLLKELMNICKPGQLFVTTHCTGFLERKTFESETKHWFIYTEESSHTEIVDFTEQISSNLLNRLGVTTRSIGQANLRLIVEGPSDGIIIEKLITYIAEIKNVKINLERDLEIVPCCSPTIFKARAISLPSRSPGLIIDAKINVISPVINIERPGVIKQWVLFDADVASQVEAINSASILYEKLGKPVKIRVLPSWYKTLECIYDKELWGYALSNYKQKNSCELQVNRLWNDPYTNLKAIIKNLPAIDTIKKNKIKYASNVSKYLTRDWVKRHLKEMEILYEIIDELGKQC